MNHHGSLHLQVIQYRVSIVLALVHFDCNCIDEAKALEVIFTELPHAPLSYLWNLHNRDSITSIVYTLFGSTREVLARKWWLVVLKQDHCIACA